MRCPEGAREVESAEKAGGAGRDLGRARLVRPYRRGSGHRFRRIGGLQGGQRAARDRCTTSRRIRTVAWLKGLRVRR
jgi:hypothetical protein